MNLAINGSILTECYGVLFEGSMCPLYVDMAALKTEMVFLSFLLNSSYSFVYGKSQQHYSSVSSTVWLVVVPNGHFHIPNQTLINQGVLWKTLEHLTNSV